MPNNDATNSGKVTNDDKSPEEKQRKISRQSNVNGTLSLETSLEHRVTNDLLAPTKQNDVLDDDNEVSGLKETIVPLPHYNEQQEHGKNSHHNHHHCCYHHHHKVFDDDENDRSRKLNRSKSHEYKNENFEDLSRRRVSAGLNPNTGDTARQPNGVGNQDRIRPRVYSDLQHWGNKAQLKIILNKLIKEPFDNIQIKMNNQDTRKEEDLKEIEEIDKTYASCDKPKICLDLINKPQRSRSQRISRSTMVRRKQWRHDSDTVVSIDESGTNSVPEDQVVEDSGFTLHRNSIHDELQRHKNSLRDKLISKGQPLTLLNALEDDRLEEALALAKEGNSRVRQNVCLLWACIEGNSDLVNRLLNQGAQPEARDSDGFSTLHLAAHSGSAATLQLLLTAGARTSGPSTWDPRGEATPLILAAQEGYPECAKLLIDNGADVDVGLIEKRESALHFAVRSGSTGCVKVLLNANATVNPLLLYSETPLHIAVDEGNSEIVDLLLTAGADLKASKGSTKASALHIASLNGYFHITNQLLKAGADPNQENSRGQTSLHLGARAQCFDTVQALLNYKANPNAADQDGRTPLHTGLIKGARSGDCLRLLIEKGADPNMADTAGYTPLHLAALNESTYCVDLFLKHGGDVTKQTKGGVSALNIILRRTPNVMGHFHENLNNAIAFIDSDRYFDRDNQIQLDFRSLVPGEEDGPECRLLSCYINERQKFILKHPLIETFILLKWIRAKSFFIFNLIFYSVFVVLVTTLFIMIFSSTVQCAVSTTDCETYLNISKITLHDTIAAPPESTVKLSQFKTSVNIMKNVSSNDESIVDSTVGIKICCDLCHENFVSIRVLLILIIVIIFFIWFKEILQVLDSPRRYFTTIDNILIWFVMILTFIIVGFVLKTKKTCPFTFHLAAIDIFLVWLGLLLHIGRFPMFGIYVQMFALVAKNFGKFLLAYLCIINAFALSFGVLLDEHSSFQHYIYRLIKVFTMMTGELEYDAVIGEVDVKYEVTTQLMFALFLIFGTIILMNLLVGLAVSDIQGLQKSAVLDRLVWQTKLMEHFEGVIFSRWVSRLFPVNAIKFIHHKLLLLPTMYGSTFIINNRTAASIPPELMEAIRRSAMARDFVVKRRQAFANFRTMSTMANYSNDSEIDVSRSMEAIRKGLDILVWDAEERRNDLTTLAASLTQLTAIVQESLEKSQTQACKDQECDVEDNKSCSSCCSRYNNDAIKE